MGPTSTDNDADVIVVGAGPGGSAAAFHLARHGAKVLLLEKSEFPREKVCGDGLTPRAVKQLVAMDIDTTGDGWARNRGLRVIGGGLRLELDWPDLSSFPNYGLTRTRLDFDQLLAKSATDVGANLRTGVNVTGPVFDDRSGRVVGVEAQAAGQEQLRFRAPIVIAADGVSGRFPLALGLTKREDRPLGVAVRRYYRSPRHIDDYLESWLELRGRDDAEKLLPGYGWIFGMGDGRVNVGLGVLNSSVEFGKTNYRQLLLEWMAGTPAEWEMNEETAEGQIAGAALPMGFNRVPHYTRGVLLVGDSGGMVNPFNGEGIAYAMESGALAAEIAVQALAEADPARRERRLQQYPVELKARYGGYYRLGGWFVKLIGRPEIMRFATKHGLPHPTLMRFVLKLLANLTETRGGDAMDRVINAMTRAVPAV
jgi:menaquinone-9 beta-reductase